MNIHLFLQTPRLCGVRARVLDSNGSVVDSLSITHTNHTHSTAVLRLSDIAHSTGSSLKIELLNRVGTSRFEIMLPGIQNTRICSRLIL